MKEHLPLTVDKDDLFIGLVLIGAIVTAIIANQIEDQRLDQDCGEDRSKCVETERVICLGASAGGSCFVDQDWVTPTPSEE